MDRFWLGESSRSHCTAQNLKHKVKRDLESVAIATCQMFLLSSHSKFFHLLKSKDDDDGKLKAPALNTRFSQETGPEQVSCPCKAHRPVLVLGGGSSGFKPALGHIDQPLPQTTHFFSLFSLCYKEQTPNPKGGKEILAQ